MVVVALLSGAVWVTIGLLLLPLLSVALAGGSNEDQSSVWNDFPSSHHHRRLLSLWPSPTIRYFEVSERGLTGSTTGTNSNSNNNAAVVSVVLVNDTVLTGTPTIQNQTVWTFRAVPLRNRARSIRFVHYYSASSTTSTSQPKQIGMAQTQITNAPSLTVEWSLIGSGRHVIAATPYSRRNAKGRTGPVRTVVVLVVGNNNAPVAAPLTPTWNPTRTTPVVPLPPPPLPLQRPITVTTPTPSTARSSTTAPWMPLPRQPYLTTVPVPMSPPAATLPTRVGVVPIALPFSPAPLGVAATLTPLPTATPFLAPILAPLPAAPPTIFTAAPQGKPEPCAVPLTLSQSVDIVVTNTKPKINANTSSAATTAVAAFLVNVTNRTSAFPTRAPTAASPVTAPSTNTTTAASTNNSASSTTNTTTDTTNTTTINNVTFIIQLELADIPLCADQVVFAQAAYTWQSIITHDLVDIDTAAEGLTERSDGCTWPEIIDDLYICATFARIDGPLKVLGYAGPEYVRNDNLLPISGIMVFDKSDLAMLRQDNGFLDTILHEMGHVIGLGSLWEYANLATESPNCTYLGVHANAEYQALSQCGNTTLPLERKGGPGTACVHWDEDCLGDELMTGYLSSFNSDSMRSPLSRLSIAAVQDLGYNVDYSRANPFGREQLDPLCTCPKRRRLGSFNDSTKRNGRRRRRRRLSEAAHALAVQAGLDYLQGNRAVADAADAIPGLRYVGDTIVSVLVADHGNVYGVLVRVDNDR
jgi:Leishmanolysin